MNILDILILCLAIIYPLFEGYREYAFYRVNQRAGFQERNYDKDRKVINVLTWLFFYLAAGSSAGIVLGFEFLVFTKLGAWLSAAAFWRWIWLDGILNLRRKDLGFFYAGNSGRSFTDRLIHGMPTWLKALLKFSAFLIALWFLLS